MAGTGGRAVALLISAAVRGLEITETPHLPVTAAEPRASPLSTEGFLSNSSFSESGVLSNFGIVRFNAASTDAAMTSNSTYSIRSAMLDHHLNPRQWDSRRTLSTNPSAAAAGSPGPPSFILQLVEKVIRFFASILPRKALVEQVKVEVDAVAAIVEIGAKVVSNFADEVEDMANTANLWAEEVEKIAEKVEDGTKAIQKIVDDVADVLEGEKGASTLVQTAEQVKTMVAAKKAQKSNSAAAATTIVSDQESVAITTASSNMK